MRDEHAYPKTGGRSGLRERPRDDDVRVAVDVRGERRPGKVRVGLVHQHQGVGIALGDGEDRVVADRVAGRVVRRREHHDLGARTGSRIEGAIRAKVVREADALVRDATARDDAEPRVHRIGRLEEERRAPMPAEDQEHQKEHLVAAVAEEELLRAHAPAIGQDAPELVTSSGIAIQENAVELGRAQVPARGIGLRPFVRLDPDVGTLPLRAVRLELRHLGPRLRQSPSDHVHRLA